MLKQFGLTIGYVGLALFLGGLLYLRWLAVSAAEIGWSIGASASGLLLALIVGLVRRISIRRNRHA